MTHLTWSTLLFVAYYFFWGPMVWLLLDMAERCKARRQYNLMHLLGSLTPFSAGLGVACLICSIVFFAAFLWPIWSGL